MFLEAANLRPVFRFPQRSFEKLIANATPLLARRNEQLREKPQVTASPAKGEAKDLTRIFGYPKTVWIVGQGEPLKSRRSWGHHWPEAMTLRQVVYAVSDQRIGSF